jgi:hypothetical protein
MGSDSNPEPDLPIPDHSGVKDLLKNSSNSERAVFAVLALMFWWVLVLAALWWLGAAVYDRSTTLFWSVLGVAAIVGALWWPGFLRSPDATARCEDGTYSYSQHRSGTCSWHGGVDEWMD